jgi:hypothetical protein
MPQAHMCSYWGNKIHIRALHISLELQKCIKHICNIRFENGVPSILYYNVGYGYAYVRHNFFRLKFYPVVRI